MKKIIRLYSVALRGVECDEVVVEVDMSPGLQSFTIVGLADTAIQESRDRIKAALKNSFDCSLRGKIVVNLAPADVRKEGPSYDLPIALGILATQGYLNNEIPGDAVFLGELSLEGSLRHVNGVLSAASHVASSSMSSLFVPISDAKEASLIADVVVFGVKDLKSLVDHLNGDQVIERLEPQKLSLSGIEYSFDFAHINGQQFAKRALEIAAAGGHNVLLSGPPGSGKTLMARSLPSIMPSMMWDEALEVSRVHSVCGLLSEEKPLVLERPFRSPHHSSSGASLVGGGSYPRPGEVSLAHRGVLFLDELPEFNKRVLEYLRQPLEDGVIQISRARHTLSFPARFSLIASMNPCPCGFYGSDQRACRCSQFEVERYQKKISGPLLDRMDLTVQVAAVKHEELTVRSDNEASKVVRARVVAARERQQERFEDVDIFTNAEMGSRHIRDLCELSVACEDLLKGACERLCLSARSYFRIVKVARTIADLSGSKDILEEHIAEALQYRVDLGR